MIHMSVANQKVTAKDELCIELQLLPVLGDDRMRELVKEALKKDGWRDNGSGGLHKSLGDGLKATLSPDAKTVTLEQEQSITVEGRATTEEQAQRDASDRADKAKDSVRRQATTALAHIEGDVRAKLDAVIQRVYVTALEEKARSMGQLESMEQTTAADGTVEVVLKVKV